MSSSLPTLNDMLDPEKKKAPQSKTETEHEKKEENKVQEEPKKESPPLEESQDEKKEELPPKKEDLSSEKEEAPKKESPPLEESQDEKKEELPPKKEDLSSEKEEAPKKEEEPKKEGDKKEGEPKVEEQKKEKKEAPKKPREPEPKIPTDFQELIKEMNEIKSQGNELFKSQSYEEAISKYKEAYDKLEKELPKINQERDYNPQSIDLITLYKQIMSNLSLSYAKTEKYEESIKYDLKIIAIDQNYDKSYVRLFNNYLNLNKREQAVYFGETLLKFHDETKQKYANEIVKIEETKKILEAEYSAIRAKQRKEMIKSVAKYAVPAIVLIAAVAIYFFVFKKK